MPATRTSVPPEFRSGGAQRPAQAQQGPVTLPPNWEPFKFEGFITERQWGFICDLLDKKDLLKSPGFFDRVNAMDEDEYAAYLAELKILLKRTTRKKASELIETLKALPYKPRPKREADTAPSVPDGRYALEMPGDELNPVHFYKINTPTEGDHAGYTFVERFVSDDTFPVKGKDRYRVLERIAANPLEAAQRYGEEFERCCICNRGLTRRLSRKMKIGPVCLRKHGEAWGLDPEQYIESNRRELVKQGLDPDENLPVTKRRPRRTAGHRRRFA